MDVIFIRWPDVKAMTGLSRATIFRLERAAKFPKRRQIGARAVAWVEGEIRQWMESRKPVGRES